MKRLFTIIRFAGVLCLTTLGAVSAPLHMRQDRIENIDGNIVVTCESRRDCNEKFIRETLRAYDPMLRQITGALQLQTRKESPSTSNVFAATVTVLGENAYATFLAVNGLQSTLAYVVKDGEVLIPTFDRKKGEEEYQATVFVNATADALYQKFHGKRPTDDALRMLILSAAKAQMQSRLTVDVKAFR